MNQIDPDKLTRHAAESLELPAVLEIVASHCVNEGARDLLRSYRLATRAEDIETAQGRIEEMRQYRSAVEEFRIADTFCRAAIQRAVDSGEPLYEKDLLLIAALEKENSLLHRKFKPLASDYPLLDRIVFGLEPQDELAERIEKTIDRDGQIRDGASERLRDIRKNIRNARNRIRGEADRSAKQFGKGAYATLYGSRYELLVPRENWRRGDGLVHSTSQSGESLYFEPFYLVELNNSLEAYNHDEKSEVMRILAELSKAVTDRAGALLSNLDVIEQLDALRARAVFSDRFDCITPGIASDGELVLRGGRHPLLVVSLQADGRRDGVVPLDLTLTPTQRIMVITGPNAGGKTVTLKTVGLLAFMFQCGLQIPCRPGSRFPVFKSIFADIGDEQSIESSLSTFTSHLQHLDGMCRRAGRGTLCLIDEIGDGTDPDEGASLANAALERLLARETAAITTTHYGKVKIFSLQTPGIQNASMAFADEENRPLYKLLQGLAGRSRGIETAKRCGFDEEVVRRAEFFLGEAAYRLESLLSELEAGHIAIEREREALAKQSEALQQVIARYTEKEQEMDSATAARNEKARTEAEEILFQARREIEHIVKEIRESGARKQRIKEGHQKIRRMLKTVKKEKPLRKAVSVAVGDRVSLKPSGGPEGVVLELGKETATVEIGGKRIKLNIENLYKLDSPADEPGSSINWDIEAEPLQSVVLDVRGEEREEALNLVDRFIDRAVLSGALELTIIHGIGERILQKAIQFVLAKDRRVKSTRFGGLSEGGVGVTIVELK